MRPAHELAGPARSVDGGYLVVLKIKIRLGVTSDSACGTEQTSQRPGGRKSDRRHRIAGHERWPGNPV